MGLNRTAFHSAVQRIWLSWPWVVVLLLLMGSEVMAQSGISVSLPNTTLVPLPPVPSIPERRLIVVPFLSISERYDDNIFQDSTNEEEDFVTTITPGIRVHYLTRRNAMLDFDYWTNFDFYSENTDQNQNSHHVNFQFVGPLSRIFSLTARDRFIFTEEPAERDFEVNPEVPPGTPGGTTPISDQSRQRTLRNRGDLLLGVQVSPRIALDLNFATILNDVDVPEEVDEFRYTLGAALGYLTHIGRQSRVFVGYDVTFFTFAVNDPDEPEPTDFEVHATNIGYRHAFTPTLTGDVSIGYAMAVADDLGFDEEGAVIASLGLLKTLKTGRAVFRYRRGFTSGGGQGGTVLADIFNGLLTTNITPKIALSLSSNLSLLNYRAAEQSDRVFWVVRPSLTYAALRFWNLSVAYDYAITSYDDENFQDRTDHRFTATSQFALLRDRLFLNLTYRYTARRFDGDGLIQDGERFGRNQVFLTVTFAPPLFLQ